MCVRAARRPWSSRPFGVAADRRPGPAARRRVRADQGNTRPWLSRTPLSADRYLRSLADVAVAAVVITISLRGPVSTLSFFRVSPIGLRDAPAQERDMNPAWTGNEKRE
jgi:hypothetical protein